jgi:hypothetical protein
VSISSGVTAGATSHTAGFAKSYTSSTGALTGTATAVSAKVGNTQKRLKMSALKIDRRFIFPSIGDFSSLTSPDL